MSRTQYDVKDNMFTNALKFDETHYLACLISGYAVGGKGNLYSFQEALDYLNAKGHVYGSEVDEIIEASGASCYESAEELFNLYLRDTYLVSKGTTKRRVMKSFSLKQIKKDVLSGGEVDRGVLVKALVDNGYFPQPFIEVPKTLSNIKKIACQFAPNDFQNRVDIVTSFSKYSMYSRKSKLRDSVAKALEKSTKKAFSKLEKDDNWFKWKYGEEANG